MQDFVDYIERSGRLQTFRTAAHPDAPGEHDESRRVRLYRRVVYAELDEHRQARLHGRHRDRGLPST